MKWKEGENEFIILDKKANELRSNCNKLCSEISELINLNKDTKDAISQINKLDKEILKLENKSSKAMNKINKKLKKLPNLALEDNLLNISIKTKALSKTKNDFIQKLNSISPIKAIELTQKKYLNSLKKVVFKANDLPLCIKTYSNKAQNFIIISHNNALEYFNDIQHFLTDNAKYLVKKSIKTLKSTSSKELCATLFDDTKINVEFSGEFVSREKSIKVYDKEIDMTKFVNILFIKIK